MTDRSFPTIPDSRRASGNPPLPRLDQKSQTNVFGLNAAQLFQVNVESKLKDLPRDYLSHIKMAYLEEGSTPSHHAYGWISS